MIKHGPAGLPGALLELAKGGGDDGQLPESVQRLVEEDEGKVKLQEKGGTFTRVALLCMVALGLTGAICLLLYLAVKLVLAGLLSLILLLLAPAMLFAPAFGESGRATFLGWAKRLIGALAAKLIYSLLLAVVVVAATALASLDIGWFGTWLLQIAFWWGILIKRKELTGFLSVGQPDEERRGASSALVRAYQTAHAAAAFGAGAKAADARRSLARACAGARDRDGARARRGAGRPRSRPRRSSAATPSAPASSSSPGARETLALRGPLERDRRALDRELAPLDRNRAKARATGERAARHRPPRRSCWLDQRARIERALDSERMRQAERSIAESERAQAREGRIVTRLETAAWREQRRRDIEQGLPPEHERSLRAAGIDPRDFADADPARRQEYLRQSRAAIEHHRSLLAALPPEGSGEADPRRGPPRPLGARPRGAPPAQARGARPHRARAPRAPPPPRPLPALMATRVAQTAGPARPHRRPSSRFAATAVRSGDGPEEPRGSGAAVGRSRGDRRARPRPRTAPSRSNGRAAPRRQRQTRTCRAARRPGARWPRRSVPSAPVARRFVSRPARVRGRGRHAARPRRAGGDRDRLARSLHPRARAAPTRRAPPSESRPARRARAAAGAVDRSGRSSRRRSLGAAGRQA